MTSDRNEPPGSGSEDAVIEGALVEEAEVDKAKVDDEVVEDAVVESDEPATTLAPRTSESGMWGDGQSASLSPPGPSLPAPDYNAAGVPSLDYVRDKIEGRYAHSLGSSELAKETPESRSFEEQAAKREEAAKEKLAAIRRSLRGDSS
jgi:hypothetical protein